MNSTNLSPKKVASAIGVSESSLKRWCDQGLIRFGKTSGGHRRIHVTSVLEFLQKSNRPIIQPELLGLSSEGIPLNSSSNDICDVLEKALLEGDENRSRRVLVDLYLDQQKISVIGDHFIKPVFENIGRRWECGSIEVFHERRACAIASRLLNELRKMTPEPQEGPVAIGGSIEKDQYTLPCMLVESVLRQSGWRAQNLGHNIPFDSFANAVHECQPRLVWISVSFIDDHESFVKKFNEFKRNIPSAVAFAVGGRALTETIRQQISYSCFCDNLQHLDAFAQTIYPIPVK